MNKKQQILDYGCGTGGHNPRLRRRGDYTGIDILPENIAYAETQYTGTFLVVEPGARLPFPDASFDEVHCYDVLEHVEDIKHSVSEIGRVLMPGGTVHVTVPARLSEQVLLMAKPDYFDQVGHMRIVSPRSLDALFQKEGVVRVQLSRRGGMEAVILALIFFLKRHGTVVEHQTGSPAYSKWIVAFIFLFDTRLFMTPLKYMVPIYLVTLPIGWLLSQVFPKTLVFKYKKMAE